MQVSSVSFGKKIPVMQAQIKDIKNNQFIPVKLSEYDCKDIDDIKEVYENCTYWLFYKNIAADMNKKRERYIKGQEQYPNKFYVMQDKNNNIIGLCETADKGKDTNIEFLETNRKFGYKYIGQTMLAMIGKRLLNRGGGNLCVAHPYICALSYYTDKCGFEITDDNKHFFSLYMKDNQIKSFIEKVQEKTNSPIREINE